MARKRTEKATRGRKPTTKRSGTRPKARKVTEVVGAAGPVQDEVRRRAYEIYLARNGKPGDPVADWLQAEREYRNAPRAT